MKKKELHMKLKEYEDKITNPATREELDEFQRLIPNKISTSTNDLLLEPFTSDDIYEAMRAIHPLKAPGNDGMSGLFYREYWPTIREEVSKGAHWRIGNGRHTRIWEDKWIPRHNGTVLYRHPSLAPNSTIHKLLNEDGEWDKEAPYIFPLRGCPLDFGHPHEHIYGGFSHMAVYIKWYIESLTHALWFCAKVKQVWKLLPFYKHIRDSKGQSMFDILVEFKNKLSKEEFEEVITILWAIWENRNRKWNKKQVMNGARLIDWVLNSYSPQITTPKQGDITPEIHNDGTWLTPPEGIACVHCDAAVIPGQVGVGLGFVWGDWNGITLSTGMVFVPAICPAIMAEAEAIAAALKASPIGENQAFEIRTDCKLLVESFKVKDDMLSDVSIVISKIKRHQIFPLCTKLIFVKRKNNELAHRLAKKSLENKITQVFSHFLFEWLADICKADLSNSL
ncbi:hypothetical protein G4B88_030282 [Cannabis sativa]|uniref:RNase H type-1 domain-containing protein n=1 Tax=Cannabis sativa TaxID=3483 RepID=A0A7J6EC65_CANSA|nr:hypothetical protein G4B88_030282 [Cannabis sativa]